MDAAWTRPDLNGSNRRDSYSGSSLLKLLKMNINSKVLALKYRPQSFDDLIGQEIVSATTSCPIRSLNVWGLYFKAKTFVFLFILFKGD